MLDEGDRVRDYTLKKFLGKGSYGEVWLAEREIELSDEGIPFALKFLTDHVGQGVNSETVRNEVKTWIKAGSHFNIVPVFDGFIHGRFLVIVSEYVDGGSLRDWLASNNGKAPSLEKAVEMARGILRGLAHLHSRKIIHRDLKPENILLRDGTPKITDFGVSRMVETFSHSTALRHTQGAGSPAYMPPEAFSECAPTPQLDTWSAGVMFYEMLSGGLPFNANSLLAIFSEITNKEPKPLPSDVPKELQEIVSTSLVKDVSGRFPTAEKMSEALDKAWARLQQREDGLKDTLSDEDWLERQKRQAEKEAQQRRTILLAEDYFNRGYECYAAKDYDGAIQNYDEAIELNPQYADAYNNRGAVYNDKGNYDQTIKDYNKAIELNPQSAMTYNNRGNVYYNKGNYDQAIKDYNKAIELNPQYANAYMNRGDAYERLGQLVKARADRQKYKELSGEK
ncbi:MAG TPA: protein kinase [Pyrinomonadaceae bacterium]|jgi:serine/threonine protein kinase